MTVKGAKSAKNSSAPVVAASAEARHQLRAARIRALLFAVLAFGALFITAGAQGVAGHFSFWVNKLGGTEFVIDFPVIVLWILTTVTLAATALLQFLGGASFRWRAALGLVALFFVFAVLARLLNGTTANLTVFFSSSLEFAIPVGIGALAGIVAERSGILNIAVEGKLLFGAMFGAIASSITGVAIAGPVAGAVSGALVSLFLAWLAIRYRVDQIIAGTVINIAAVGITTFAYIRILQVHTEFNLPVSVAPVSIPVLSEIPVVGPIFFTLSPYFYAAVVLIGFFTYMIYRTQWGLRLRAAGEQPSAAGTVGINIVRLRYRAMLIAGLLAGFAGSYLSLSGTGGFGVNTSAGKGFIALAAVIFGAWNPVYAFGASLIFGLTTSATTLLSGLGVGLPPQILLSMPYVVTIIVVAGLVGRVRGPASAGRPYDQG